MLTWLTESANPQPLGLARIVIGVAASIKAIVILPVLLRLSDPDIVNAPRFDWFPEPTVGLALATTVIWFVAAVSLTMGWRAMLAGWLLLASIVFVLFLDLQTYSNHLYLMAWLVFLLVLADSGSGLSLDRRARPVLRWPVLLLMLQGSLVYGFAAVTKLNTDFLSGRVLAGVLNDGLLSLPDALRTPGVLAPLAVGAVMAEAFLAMALWIPRFRPAAFIVGLGMHSAITLFMANTWELLVFSLEMLALYPLFIPEERLLVVWDDECGSCRDWVRRFTRLDVLGLLTPLGKGEPGHNLLPGDVEESLHVIQKPETTRGFMAITRILEVLVPTLWVAPLLRLPGLRSLGERWYRWQARRRSCLVGVRV